MLLRTEESRTCRGRSVPCDPGGGSKGERMTTVGPGSDYSPSVQRALDWAQVVARVRERVPPGLTSPPSIEPGDILIGALLAHPDRDSEASVLLEHFGLTARDVLGVEYAGVTPTALAAAAPDVAPGSQPPDGRWMSELLTASRRLSAGSVQLLHLVGALLTTRSPLLPRLDVAFNAIGETREVVADSYQQWVRGGPQDNGVAGQLLRRWLEEHNPRSPVSVAGFATDSVLDSSDVQPDLVGISSESNALAYLVASRQMVPPLAVGLFGDWGSGKSYLMRDVRNRIDGLIRLSKAQPQTDAVVWHNIKHVEFNAWEYVQGDLWAALLEKVFSSLGVAATRSSLVAERKEPLKRELAREEAAALSAREQASKLATELEDREKSVLSAETKLKQAQKDAAAPPTAEEALRIAKNALADQVGPDKLSELAPDVAELTAALTDAWGELRFWRQLMGPYWRNWKHIALVTGIALVVPVVVWVLQQFTQLPEVSVVLTAFAASIPPVTLWLRSVTGWVGDQRERVQRGLADLAAIHSRPVNEAREELATAERDLRETQALLNAEQAKVADAQARAQSIEADLRSLTPGRVLVDFASQRSSDYRSRLGLLGAVREDLRRLQETISGNNAASPLLPDGDYDSSMPNRIVLYVDDLDRCPPAKVVQVLEAVHLLLAFPLFVVFVAVDSRWLSSALIEELHALRTLPGATLAEPGKDPTTPPAPSGRDLDDEDTPTARDYLEKIFQLPFWVQPLSGEQRGNIVSGLLAGSVRSEGAGAGRKDGGLTLDAERADIAEQMLTREGTGLRLETSTLSLSPRELEFLTTLGPLLGDTPRQVKRFVNTIQFLLSMSPPVPANGSPSPRQTVALYSAIHEGLPSIARRVFDADAKTRKLADVLAEPGLDEREKRLLSEWMNEPGRQIWRQVTLGDIGDRSVMIPRLSFQRPAT